MTDNMIARKMTAHKTVLLSMWLLFTVLISFVSFHRLTYLEFITNGHTDGKYTVMAQKGEFRTVDFNLPYDFIRGVSFQIGTFARDNNSSWVAAVLEKNSEKILCKKIFEASAVVDKQWNFIDFGKNIKIDRTKEYQVKIEAKNVSGDTSLAFYTENDIPCLKIHGGNFDSWWLGLTFFWSAFVLFMILRSFRLKKAGTACFDDRIFVGMLIACSLFALMFFFKDSSYFIDENDNMNGGLLIANGRVLYRDYVTQHTPFAYYLCSVFALLGAKSVEQFRLSYYVLEGIIFGLFYIRHLEAFGRMKMILLPLAEIVIVNVAVPFGGAMVLSDSIQGLCFVGLLLEFLAYCKDGKIDWIRSAVVSACVWFSFGSAFVSAYSLVWILIAVIVMEINACVKNEILLKEMSVRFLRLLIAVFVPLAAATAYFVINHAFVEAVRQFYVFNRRVYTIYQPYGTDLLQPVFYSLKNFGDEIRNNLKTSWAAKSFVALFKVLVLSGTFVLSLKRFLLTRKLAESLIPFAVFIMSASRGYAFHGIAAWNVAILIVVLYGYDFFLRISRKYIPVSALLLFLTCFPFFSAVCDGALKKQSQVPDFESMIVESTEDGEEILLDGWCSYANYLLAKNRLPVNKALYMLPWYMDWYESDTISELNIKKPRFAVFNEESECWGHRNFTRRLYDAVKKDYIKISPNFWQRKDSVPTADNFDEHFN